MVILSPSSITEIDLNQEIKYAFNIATLFLIKRKQFLK